MRYDKLFNAATIALALLFVPSPPVPAALCSPQPCVDANDGTPRADTTPDPASDDTLPLKYQVLSTDGNFELFYNTILDDPDEGIRYSGSLTPVNGAAYVTDVIARAEADAQEIADYFDCVWWLFTDKEAVDSDGIDNFLPFRKPNAPMPHGSPHLDNPDADNIPSGSGEGRGATAHMPGRASS